MAIEIVETTQDLSGAFLVRILLPNGDTEFLKFREKPTLKKVRDLWQERKNAERQEKETRERVVEITIGDEKRVLAFDSKPTKRQILEALEIDIQRLKASNGD